MSKTALFFTLSAGIFLVACQGGSDSSSDNEGVSKVPAPVICPSTETFEIDGIELDVELYDRDNDGCLSDFEHRVATRVADQLREQQENGLVVDGINTASGLSRINSMKVIGSSEVSDNKIQLHTNMDSGRFHISFDSYVTRSPNQSLKLYFGDESEAGKGDTTPLFAMTFPLAPMTGNISYVFGCSYLSSVSVNCNTLVVTDTDNVGARVMTLDIDRTFPLQLTFSGQTLPQTGYIIATFCDESGDNASCLNNYAEIPVSFN